MWQNADRPLKVSDSKSVTIQVETVKPMSFTRPALFHYRRYTSSHHHAGRATTCSIGFKRMWKIEHPGPGSFHRRWMRSLQALLFCSVFTQTYKLGKALRWYNIREVHWVINTGRRRMFYQRVCFALGFPRNFDDLLLGIFEALTDWAKTIWYCLHRYLDKLLWLSEFKNNYKSYECNKMSQISSAFHLSFLALFFSVFFCVFSLMIAPRITA